MPNIKILP